MPDPPACSSAAPVSGSGLRRQRVSLLLAGIVSAGVGFVAFTPALRNGFVYDDLLIVVNNRTVTESGPWYRFWRERWWPRGVSSDPLYRPLTLWSFRANVVVPETIGSALRTQ